MPERLNLAHVNSQLAAMKTDYANGVLAIFGGAAQPADCNDAETGTLLCLITKDSGAFVAGVATNGLNFGGPVDGVLDKDPAETWSGTVLAAAGGGTTATWFRFYDNSYTTGAAATTGSGVTGKRFDGAISTSATAELPMANPVLVEGAPIIITGFPVTPPRA